jgi:hypothetical protein
MTYPDDDKPKYSDNEIDLRFSDESGANPRYADTEAVDLDDEEWDDELVDPDEIYFDEWDDEDE